MIDSDESGNWRIVYVISSGMVGVSSSLSGQFGVGYQALFRYPEKNVIGIRENDPPLQGVSPFKDSYMAIWCLKKPRGIFSCVCPYRMQH